MTPHLPFAIKITDLNEAVALAEHWATHMVSLLDPNYAGTVPHLSLTNHLCRHYFHDIVPAQVSHPIWQELNTQPQLMQKNQVEQVLAFTQSLGAQDKLLVHCHAGISRSTAMTCGILCQHGLSPEQAWAQVFTWRPIASPNPYILGLIDEVLGLAGKLQDLGEQFAIR